MTNGVSSFLKKNFRRILAVIIAKSIPTRYRVMKTKLACCGKNVPISKTYTGILALHDMNGFIRIVMIRLLRLSIVRDAIIAGTLHPNPIIKGINDFPCSPIRCMILSMIKAARAM